MNERCDFMSVFLDLKLFECLSGFLQLEGLLNLWHTSKKFLSSDHQYQKIIKKKLIRLIVKVKEEIIIESFLNYLVDIQ